MKSAGEINQMEPLSRRFYRKIKHTNIKLLIFLLLSVFIFEFLFFPIPLLASSSEMEIADHPSTTKYYLVSQETIDNEGFFVIIKDHNTIDVAESEDTPQEENVLLPENDTKNINIGHFPKNTDKKTISTHVSVISAYNSEVAQCDASPCTTATGFNVCKHGIEDTVAANHLPFGTKIKIPELFGDRVFIVRDRMNKRYTGNIDVWMKNKKDALQLGRRTARVEIIQ